MILRWLISAIGFAALKEEIRRATRRAILATVAIVLWLIALGFLLAAFTVWLASVVGPIIACAIIAGVFIVIALIIQISLALTKRNRQATAPLAGIAASGAMPELGVAGAIAGAALVAYLLGRQFFRR
ncbi:MAG: hypothetical protein WDM94_00305 [Bauldia sp.]